MSCGSNCFSCIASAGTFIVNTRFSTSFGWGGSVIWIGINFFGSNAVCCIVDGPFCEFDDAVDGCDVVGCSGSVLTAGFCCCWFFAGCVVFGTVDASGGILLVLPFTDVDEFFCSTANAFFDFVPLACKDYFLTIRTGFLLFDGFMDEIFLLSLNEWIPLIVKKPWMCIFYKNIQR